MHPTCTAAQRHAATRENIRRCDRLRHKQRIAVRNYDNRCHNANLAGYSGKPCKECELLHAVDLAIGRPTEFSVFAVG